MFSNLALSTGLCVYSEWGPTKYIYIYERFDYRQKHTTHTGHTNSTIYFYLCIFINYCLVGFFYNFRPSASPLNHQTATTNKCTTSFRPYVNHFFFFDTKIPFHATHSASTRLDTLTGKNFHFAQDGVVNGFSRSRNTHC